jgi:hypothetical protein
VEQAEPELPDEEPAELELPEQELQEQPAAGRGAVHRPEAPPPAETDFQVCAERRHCDQVRPGTDSHSGLRRCDRRECF